MEMLVAAAALLIRLLSDAVAQGSLVKAALAAAIVAYCGAGLYTHAAASMHAEAAETLSSASNEVARALAGSPSPCNVKLSVSLLAGAVVPRVAGKWQESPNPGHFTRSIGTIAVDCCINERLFSGAG